jgi:hypothetical protein
MTEVLLHSIGLEAAGSKGADLAAGVRGGIP